MNTSVAILTAQGTAVRLLENNLCVRGGVVNGTHVHVVCSDGGVVTCAICMPASRFALNPQAELYFLLADHTQRRALARALPARVKSSPLGFDEFAELVVNDAADVKVKGVDFGNPQRLGLPSPTEMETLILGDARMYSSVVQLSAGVPKGPSMGHFISFFGCIEDHHFIGENFPRGKIASKL
jgi:hypothetical protein